MGRDRRKRDRRQNDTDSSNNVETNVTADTPTPLGPRGQREPRNRAGQDRREATIKKDTATIEKPACENSSEKKEESKDVPPDPAVLFANLKRETDDIKALKEKKFAKRQIFSNWSRYDEPLPDPVQEEELPGADFKHLCDSKTTGNSSYFQLKSERSWDTNISALSSELFSVNADNLAAGLGCIPFYERLDLPIFLFSETDIKWMDGDAKLSKGQYENSKADFYKKKELDINISLKERSNAEDNLPLKTEREQTPDNKPTLSFSIDRPETPDDFDSGLVTEVDKQAPSMPPRATNFARKGSPETVNKTSKLSEANMTAQELHKNINGPSPKNPEINFNANILSILREGRDNSSKDIEENIVGSQELFEKHQPSRNKVYQLPEEISGDISEKCNVIHQRKSISPETEKIQHFDKEGNCASPEISSYVIDQSEPVAEETLEEPIPEPVPEILPPRQMNKSKSKDKKKRHNLEMGNTATDSEALTPPVEPELKNQNEIISNSALNEDARYPEEVQKSISSTESLGQRSKKRRSKDKGQHANKPVENTKMATQEKPEITNTLAEEKANPVAQELTVEKAKSPSPEKPVVKLQSVPQTKHTEVLKPKHEKMAEPVKNVQEKSAEKARPKQEKRIEKVKPKEEKPLDKVKPKEEKVKQDDDLDFLLSLRKPVRESQTTPGTSTQITKPSIEEDDTSAKPAAFKFPQQTEDLEDWLDSVLDD